MLKESKVRKVIKVNLCEDCFDVIDFFMGYYGDFLLECKIYFGKYDEVFFGE